MLIVMPRGTSGSGKSWVVRQVLSNLGGPTDIVWRPAKGKHKLPLYYLVGNLAVIGHYESPCGGGDTIGSARAIYSLIHSLPPDVTAVLVEGLLLSEDSKWTGQLQQDGHTVRCLFLTTPVEQCLTQIKQRRVAAGNDKPLNEHNTRNRVGVIERARVKLTEHGVLCRRVTAGQAAGVITRWLQQAALPSNSTAMSSADD